MLMNFRTVTMEVLKNRQKKDFNCHYCVHELPVVPDITNVWVTSGDSNTGKSTEVTVPDVPYLTRTDSEYTTPGVNRVMTCTQTGTPFEL